MQPWEAQGVISCGGETTSQIVPRPQSEMAQIRK